MYTKFNKNYILFQNNKGNVKYFFDNGSIMEILKTEKTTFRTISADGEISYVNENNDLDRIDGPAFITISNEYEYWLNGKKHNNSGPNNIELDGEITYFSNNELNNFYGPALYKKNGDMYFYLNGQKHNYNGPAVIKNTGEIVYFKLNQKHNEEVAAIQNINGEEKFFINNEEISREDFETNYNKLIKGKIV
jgi:hypothetical protein